MSNQKMTYILAWNGFVRERCSVWTNGIHILITRPHDYLLVGGNLSFNCDSSKEMVDFLIENKICVECPVNSESMESYFILNGFTKNENKWNKSGIPEVAFVKKNMGAYLFDNRLYTFALLKKKLRDYGCLEVKEILPKGRINA